MESNGNPGAAAPVQPLVSPRELHHPWFNELEAALEANDLERVDCLCRGAVEDRRASLTARFRASVTLASLTSGGNPWEHFKRAQVCATVLLQVAMESPDPDSPHLEVNRDGVSAFFGILEVLEKDLMKLDQNTWLRNVKGNLIGPRQGEAAEQPQIMVQAEPSAAAAAAAAASAEVTANTTIAATTNSPSPNNTDPPPTERRIPLFPGLELVEAYNASH